MHAVLSRLVMSDSATLWTVARQAPLSMRFFQARVLEWITIPCYRVSSQPRDELPSPASHVDSLPLSHLYIYIMSIGSRQT